MIAKGIDVRLFFKVSLGIICALAIYYFALSLDFGQFTPAGKHAFAVFCVGAFLWITNIFPLAITGIIVLFLLPASDAIKAHDIYSYFGNSAVFFVLGAFILASPVMRSGLSKRMAISIISKFGKGPKTLTCSIFILSSFLAFFISEHAVAAMLLPIVIEIVKATKVSTRSRFAFASYMAMAWGAMIGGTATLLGGARAPLALGILQDTFNSNHKLSHFGSISFIEWTWWVIPIVLIILAVALVFVLLIAHNSQANIELAQKTLLQHKEKMGKISIREILTLLVLLFTIFLWVFYGTSWGLDWIALLGVILAFLLRITNWKEVERDVQWGIFIMYGSAIALSVTLQQTGAAQEIVHFILALGIESPIVIFILLIALACILTELMSNAAAVAVLLPIALALSIEYGIDPRVMTIAIATSAGLTFMLPVSTPAMALVINSEYVRLQRAFLWGSLLKIIGFFVIIIVALSYWPLIGLNIVI